MPKRDGVATQLPIPEGDHVYYVVEFAWTKGKEAMKCCLGLIELRRCASSKRVVSV